MANCVAWLPTMSAVLWVAVVLSFRSRLVGTTLLGPWAWALAGMATWGLLEAAIAWQGDSAASWVVNLRYASGCLLLCPAVSVLGAKRPQNGAWHFVVASLWFVLILPAVEAYFVRRGGELLVHDARGWFLWGLMVVGSANYAGTRFWASAALWGVGMAALLAPQLPLLSRLSSGAPAAAGFCFVAASLLASWAMRHPPAGEPRGWGRVWCDFRDLYGVVWTLRVAERFNALSELQRWPFELSWPGLRAVGKPDAVPQRVATRGLMALLCRFVSADWIRHRLGHDHEEEAATEWPGPDDRPE